jgi:hypothetical protein
MHRGHDHHQNLDDGAGSIDSGRLRNRIGHNRGPAPAAAAQWQTLHADAKPSQQAGAQHETDIDQVEAAFIDGFLSAPDPTSFLRLAGIPFETSAADGTRLVLLRVETDSIVDVGGVTPHVGGASFQYNPLPGRLVTRRRRIGFVYFDGRQLRALSFAEARESTR